MRNQKGFTLIELMVVVVIIGILAAIAIPRFIGAQRRARVGAAIADVETIRQALGLYEVDRGRFPGTVGGWYGAYSFLKDSLVDPYTRMPYVRLPVDGKTFNWRNYHLATDTTYRIAAHVANISPVLIVLANQDSIWVLPL